MAGPHKWFKIRGIVQHYSWGGSEYIPFLLDQENAQGMPHAEYWLGAHPNHPARVEGTETSLKEIIERNRESILGSQVAGRFSSLPFLFKILDVKNMLSIQVHPSLEEARKGYALENQQQIPVTAPNRNYKDANHKPEMMIALSDFWLLHGFKEAGQLRNTLDAVPELRFLAPVFGSGNYKGLYEQVMRLPQAEVDRHLKPLLERIIPLYEAGRFSKDQEDFWAARAALTFNKGVHADRGIFSIYLFNLLHLRKGEGIYQPSGMPHAYLEGQNVEVMANSDNVLRAGLTDKYIDVEELMKHVQFEATIPQVLNPSNDSVRQFPVPAAEFEVMQYALSEGQEEHYHTESAGLLFVLKGAAVIGSDTDHITLARGEALFTRAGLPVHMKAVKEAEIYRVSVPVS